MAELALGAISLIGPTYHLYKRCSNLISNIRHIHRDLQRISDHFEIQRRRFLREWLIILSFIEAKDVAIAMLEQGDAHPRWKEPDFQQTWNEIMADDFDRAIAMVNETLATLENRMNRMQSLVLETNRSLASSTTNTTNASSGTRLKRIGWTAGWAATGKAECLGLIQKLRAENQDLKGLREQHAVYCAIPSRPQFRELEAPLDPNELFAQLLDVREVSKALYASLENIARCPCHFVSLQLKSLDNPTTSSRISLKEPRVTRFRLIVSNGDSSKLSDEDCDCTCIAINSGPGDEVNPHTTNTGTEPDRSNVPHTSKRSGKRVRFIDDEAEEYQNPSKDTQLKMIGMDNQDTSQSVPVNVSLSTDMKTGKRVMNIDLGGANKRIKIHIDEDSQGNLSELSLTGFLAPNPTECASETSPPVLESLSAKEVDDLCKLIRTLNPSKNGNEPIGRMTSRKGSSKLQHMLYRDQLGVFRGLRTSLGTILSQREKQIARVDRIRMCLTLSLSLLYFGSYSKSFFQKSWRSSDIFFFQDSANASTGVLTELDPYVVPLFLQNGDQESFGQVTKSGSGIARNEQLFSLAVVLIEVAFGRSLWDIETPGSVEYAKGDAIAEYIKAKRIVNSGMLVREMGPKFAQLVKRCLFCDFGDDIDHEDLTKREMQEIFYRMVVSQLQKCLEWYTM